MLDHQHAKWRRYLDAKIDCSAVEALEALSNKLYFAKRDLTNALPCQQLINPLWFPNRNLDAVSQKCRYIPSLATVIQYERDLKVNNNGARS